MIYRSATACNTAQLNHLTLLGNDDVWYVVDRETYDAALLLRNMWNDKEEDFIKLLGVTSVPTFIRTLKDTLPEPLDILAYYLCLVEDPNNELESDIGKQVGALSVMSSQINFYSVINIPIEVRRSLKFTRSIFTEYKRTYSIFEGTLYDIPNTVSYTPTVPTATSVISEPEDEEDDPYANYVFTPLKSTEELEGETGSTDVPYTSSSTVTTPTPSVPANEKQEIQDIFKSYMNK